MGESYDISIAVQFIDQMNNAFVMSRCEKIIDHLADWTDSLKR
jgi:hypothetical protein